VYGFKKVDNRLEIDPTAADTVRLIFNLAASGKNLTEIAGVLYADKRPTPSEHRRAAENPSCIWSNLVIYTMLYDEQYIGTYTAGKSRRMEVGSRKVKKVDESEWIKILAHHPVIVDEATFKSAQERISYKSEPLRRREITTSDRYDKIERPLKGKVVCGCCGRKMRVSCTRNATFQCHYTFAVPDAECYRLKILSEELEAIVLKQIHMQARAIIKRADNPPPEPLTVQDAQMNLINDEKCAVYERYINREITAEELKAAMGAFEDDSVRVRNAQAILVKEAAKKESINGFRQIAADAVKAKTLNRELADALIDRVRVHPDGGVEIVWKIDE
jgi:hypothetical protein